MGEPEAGAEQCRCCAYDASPQTRPIRGDVNRRVKNSTRGERPCGKSDHAVSDGADNKITRGTCAKIDSNHGKSSVGISRENPIPRLAFVQIIKKRATESLGTRPRSRSSKRSFGTVECGHFFIGCPHEDLVVTMLAPDRGVLAHLARRRTNDCEFATPFTSIGLVLNTHSRYLLIEMYTTRAHCPKKQPRTFTGSRLPNSSFRFQD